MKLDISKAYDRVNWQFLKQRMRDMGFCSKWIDWIMLCVSTVSYDFCLNGSTVGPICPRRGLRQGDPLSPYLFLLCVEGLSNAMDRAQVTGSLHGCRVSPTAPEVTHLLFADDSFLFFRASSEEASRVKNILVRYEEISGKAVNFQKSGVLFSANVRRDKQEELGNILGVHNDITTINYLGLPAMVGRSKKRMFGFINNRVHKRIQDWRAKPISRASKEVLLKTVAQAIPSFCMSCFVLPKSLCQEINRMFNHYWWVSNMTESRGIKWHSWDNMSMSKDRGGLGFRSLQGYNLALVGKHVWKCINSPNLLVSRVLKAKYFPDDHILKAAKGQGSIYIWTGIWSAKESLKAGFRWVVGDGKDISCCGRPLVEGESRFSS